MGNRDSISQIQGIRAVAIMIIFLSHTISFLTTDELVIHAVSQWGRYGVEIFVLLSGILLAIHEKSYNFQGTLWEGFLYAKRKIGKLYGLHILMYAICAILILIRGTLSGGRFLVYTLFNITLTQSYIPFSGIINSFNGPSWYLSMCGFIWFFTPIFVIWSRKYADSKQQLVRCCAVNILVQLIWLAISKIIIQLIDTHVSIINTSWFADWLTYFCPVLNGLIYCFGFLVTKLYFQGKHNPTSSKLNILAKFIMLVIIAEEFIYGYFAERSVVGYIPMMIIFAYFLIKCIFSGEGNLGVLLKNRLLVSIGNLSSYLFLIHGPVNFILREIGSIPVGVKFFASLTISFILSYGCWYFQRKRMVNKSMRNLVN